MIEFYEGDNRETLRRLIDQGVRVHSCVCDPPYGLVATTKRFGKDGAAPAKFGSDGAFARASAGFMGSKWDATGIERDPEFWALVLEILLPGGYVAAFSSPRTGHRQACAMEDAGFIMHPFKGWVYGSGFPKAHNAERAVSMACCELGGRHYANAVPKEGERRPGDHVCPEAPEAVQWEGWAYGGQSCKPALEPIYIGQKPFSEKNGALNLLRHGVGALNIDACRVEGGPSPSAAMRQAVRSGDATAPGRPGEYYEHAIEDRSSSESYTRDRPGEELGRYPANLLHDGSEAVLACFPNAPGQLADASTNPDRRKTQNVYGEMRAASAHRPGEASADSTYGDRGSTSFTGKPGARRADAGSAARFFNAFEIGPDEWVAEPIVDPVHYHAKAGKTDRAGSKHPTVKPIGLMRWLCRLLTPPGGIVLDPFSGSGTTGVAALAEGFSCVLMEADPTFATDIRTRFSLPRPVVTDAEIEALIGLAPVEFDLIG
jgi:site-specific DNA-methyltransferase (adenine-specific)